MTQRKHLYITQHGAFIDSDEEEPLIGRTYKHDQMIGSFEVDIDEEKDEEEQIYSAFLNYTMKCEEKLAKQTSFTNIIRETSEEFLSTLE